MGQSQNSSLTVPCDRDRSVPVFPYPGDGVQPVLQNVIENKASLDARTSAVTQRVNSYHIHSAGA